MVSPFKTLFLSIGFLAMWILTDAQSLRTTSITPFTANGGGSGSSSGQEAALVGLRTDIIPHSPEAEALGKYGVLPVTLYSGMPSISVPIYELKTPSIDLPFSLSYNYNGYKPNEYASWVGMGWALQGGGVITRIVNNQVDESMAAGSRYDDYINLTMMTWSQPFLTSIAQKQVDSEPDVYIFNIGGYTGKFILIKGQAYLFPYQNLRITQVGSGFKITDDKGNNYLFNNYETTHQTALGLGNIVPAHQSAWFVSTIISADTKDTINFGYNTYTYSQPNNYIETYSINGSLGTGLNTSGHTYTEYAVQGDHIDGLLLTSVTSKYGNINFNPSAVDRQDLNGSTGDKYLDNIVVTNSDGSFSKQLILNHGYFGNSTNSRLNLQSVKIIQNFPVPDSSIYSFQYAGNTGSIPDNGTKGVDMFGYYNGKDNNAMLFPAGTFNPSLYTYGDRSANMQASQLGILSQIKYPTGGYTNLTYEQNQNGYITYVASPSNDPVRRTDYESFDTLSNGCTWGGWQVVIDSAQWLKLTVYAVLDEDTIPGNISMCSIAPGIVYNGNYKFTKIIYTTKTGMNNVVDSVFLVPGTYTVGTYCSKLMQTVFLKTSYVVHTPAQNTLSDGPGLRVRNITSYDFDGTPLLTKQYYYNYGGGMNGGGVSGSNLHADCANYDITTFTAGLHSALSEFSNEQFYYQQVDEVTQDSTQTGKTSYVYEATGGMQLDVKPASQTEYQYKNLGYLPVKNTTFQYQTTQVSDFTSAEVMPVTVVGNACQNCQYCFELQSPDPTQAADVLTAYGLSKVTEMTSQYTVISSQGETEYDLNGQPAMQKQVNYFYDNPSQIYPTRIVTNNSKGETITTQMKYPFDYTLGQNSSLNTINTAFSNDLGLAKNAVSSCLGSEETALQPYQPYHANTTINQQQFATIAGQYNCQATFKSATATAISNRSAAWNQYYATLNSLISSNSTLWQKGVLWMQQNNIVSPVIEKYITVKKADSNVYLISATRNEFNLFNNINGGQATLPAVVSQVEIGDSLLFSSFQANPDNYYKAQINYGYDNGLNLAFQNKVNDMKISYLWNYRNVYPVAQVMNADSASIAYTSFEGDNPGKWTFSGSPVNDASAVTGKNSYLLNGSNNIVKTGLNSNQTYTVSYWTKNASALSITGTMAGYPIAGRSFNGWRYFEHKITGQTQVSISGTTSIDELRLYPSAAQMTTYCYTPICGLTSQCDVNNRITYYEYDGMGRLKDIRDQDGNIMKTIEYHYRKQ